MNIKLICVGKIKESFYRDAISEYVKRLSRYCSLAIVEVEDEKTPDKASDALEEQIKEKEGKRILEKVSDCHMILLDIGGKKYDSIGFAHQIEDYGIRGKSNLCFVIGGSLGVSKEVRNRADERISFSDMTFPHQLMRVILLEQLYRCYRIIHHEPYHK